MANTFKVIFVFLATALIVAVIMALPAMLIWNDLMPAVFGLPKISFWQALELVFLCRLLFIGGRKKEE